MLANPRVPAGFLKSDIEKYFTHQVYRVICFHTPCHQYQLIYFITFVCVFVSLSFSIFTSFFLVYISLFSLLSFLCLNWVNLDYCGFWWSSNITLFLFKTFASILVIFSVIVFIGLVCFWPLISSDYSPAFFVESYTDFPIVLRVCAIFLTWLNNYHVCASSLTALFDASTFDIWIAGPVVTSLAISSAHWVSFSIGIYVSFLIYNVFLSWPVHNIGHSIFRNF